MITRKIASAVACLAFVLGAAAAAQAQDTMAPAASATAAPVAPNDGQWHYALTPYLWLPNINGNAAFSRPTILPNPPAPGNVNVGINIGPNNYLSNLNFAVMLAAEAHRKNFGIYADYINLNLSSSAGGINTISGPGGIVQIPITSAVNVHLSSSIFDLAAAITVANGHESNLDAFLGGRNFSVRTQADYSITGPITEIPVTGSLNGSDTLTDAVVGIRGRIRLADRWFANFYGDIGTGNANTTYQTLAGVVYGGRTNDVILDWRTLGYNMNSTKTLQNIKISGPALALRIHW